MLVCCIGPDCSTTTSSPACKGRSRRSLPMYGAATSAPPRTRDVARLQDWDRRAARSPLGAGALAGSTLPVDPVATAADLGFTSACPNSVDAVSDRDFAAEFLFCAALLGVHLSRLGEELV